MPTSVLRFVHVIFVILWGGCAVADIFLEFYSWTRHSKELQGAAMRLHRFLDFSLEGPTLLIAAASGAALAHRMGWLASGQSVPRWLIWKLVCVGVILAANLSCIVFVDRRLAAAKALPEGASPLADPVVSRWNLAVGLTFLAAPFGFLAVWLAVNH